MCCILETGNEHFLAFSLQQKPPYIFDWSPFWVPNFALQTIKIAAFVASCSLCIDNASASSCSSERMERSVNFGKYDR